MPARRSSIQLLFIWSRPDGLSTLILAALALSLLVVELNPSGAWRKAPDETDHAAQIPPPLATWGAAATKGDLGLGLPTAHVVQWIQRQRWPQSVLSLTVQKAIAPSLLTLEVRLQI